MDIKAAQEIPHLTKEQEEVIIHVLEDYDVGGKLHYHEGNLDYVPKFLDSLERSDFEIRVAEKFDLPVGHRDFSIAPPMFSLNGIFLRTGHELKRKGE